MMMFQVKTEMNRRRGRGSGWQGDIPEVIPGSRGKDIFTEQNLFLALVDNQ